MIRSSVVFWNNPHSASEETVSIAEFSMFIRGRVVTGNDAYLSSHVVLKRHSIGTGLACECVCRTVYWGVIGEEENGMEKRELEIHPAVCAFGFASYRFGNAPS